MHDRLLLQCLFFLLLALTALDVGEAELARIDPLPYAERKQAGYLGTCLACFIGVLYFRSKNDDDDDDDDKLRKDGA
jgi:hypothetical protein